MSPKIIHSSLFFAFQGELGLRSFDQPFEVFFMSDRHKYGAEGRHQNNRNRRAERDQQYRAKKHGKSSGERHIFGDEKQNDHNSRCDQSHTPIDDVHCGKADKKALAALKFELEREGMTEHTEHSRVRRSKLKVNSLSGQKPRKKSYDNGGF